MISFEDRIGIWVLNLVRFESGALCRCVQKLVYRTVSDKQRRKEVYFFL